MKLLILLTSIACLHASAEGFGQTITLSLENAPLEKAFKEIKRQTGYSFVYTRTQLKNTLPVSIHVAGSELKTVLDLCFRNQPLSFVIEDHYIIVQTKVVAAHTPSPEMPLIDINGRVLKEDSEPVEGASVLIKGTQRGTTTNNQGYFELKDVDENGVLIITGVSIETIEISISGKSSLAINVKTKIAEQKEVVINAGYYKTTDKLKTGNISRVDAEIIAKQPVSNVLQALQGRVPGLHIIQQTGVPGGGFTVQLRGQNSIKNGNDPLYIIDGVPFTSQSLVINGGIINAGSPLNYINPFDIESIEILKDADATAIYGSRAANGVILISTKKGKAGKTRVDINVFGGIGKVSHMMELLNTQQYVEMRKEAYKNDRMAPTVRDGPDLLVWDTTRYTNWQEELIGGTANILDAQVSFTGGNNNTQFLIGGGYHGEGSVFPGDFFDRKASAHFNISNASTDQKFKVLLSGIYLVDENNQSTRDFTSMALQLAPNAPQGYDDQGNLNWPTGYDNPYHYLLIKYQGKANNMIGNARVSYKIMKGLDILASVGYNNIQLDEINVNPKSAFNPAFGVTTGTSAFADTKVESWIAEPQAEYTTPIAKGNLTAIAGVTFQQSVRQSQSLLAKGYTNDALLETLRGATNITLVNTNYTKYNYNAIFGRLGYDWQKKYLINLTARWDGSSRFGPGKQFANFGALGLGWIFSNEKFVEKKIKFLSYGKIRGSFGTTGNDQIPDYGFMDLYNSTSYPYGGSQGLYANNLFNPDYAWEVNKKLEVAVELGFFKDRVRLACSYYLNSSANQLVGYSVPAITGFSFVQANLPAVVENKGWEVELSTINVKTEKFNFTTAINLSVPRNKLVEYPGIESSSYAAYYEVGKSLFIAKRFHAAGVNPQSGLYQFQDLKGNITTDPIYPDDLQALKEIGTKFFGGIQNSFYYKGWQLDIFFQYVNQTAHRSLGFDVPGFLTNQPVSVLDRWRNPGDLKSVQQFTQTYDVAWLTYLYYSQVSDDIIDASFLRLKNTYLSYNLPVGKLARVHLQGLKLFIEAQNLLTITNYKGMDPENKNTSSLPPLRVVTAGIQITF